MTRRPPSARDEPDDRFDQLHEGVPPWLAWPLIAWVEGFIVHYLPMGGKYFESDVIHRIDMAVRFDPPLPTSSSEEAAASIFQRFRDDSAQQSMLSTTFYTVSLRSIRGRPGTTRRSSYSASWTKAAPCGT